MYFTDETLMRQQLSLHLVGNKSAGERLQSAPHPIELNDGMHERLQQFFSSGFKPGATFQFYHESDLSLNEVYVYAQKVFEDEAQLHPQATHIAQHLFNQSTHPMIKAGELYVVYFEDCVLEGEVVDAIGIFKTENRETFLDVRLGHTKSELTFEQGISLLKPDKSCIIFNTSAESGYVVAIADHTGKGQEAAYWKDDFLKIIEINNYYAQTNEFLSIAHEFVTKQLEEEFEVSKADKIDYLNRSVSYFKNNESFEKEEFVKEVFDDPNLISSFEHFDQQRRNEYQIDIPDEFRISETAVKKKSRVFKSVLKLDKNFHIYIHGDREKIEQGVDENGRKFYKIFYDQEL